MTVVTRSFAFNRFFRFVFAVLALVAAAQLGASSAAQAEIVQQTNKMVGTGSGSSSQQGQASAISGDGTTAIVGGHGDAGSDGAIWIYTRSGATWSQQGNKLVGTGAIGTDAAQGWSVAISHDGNTVAVGGIWDNGTVGGGVGAVWIFVRSGGVWTQQQKLIGSGAVGNSWQGLSVALSRDGNTVMFGGPQDDGNKGAAWVFTRSGTTWTQQGPKLVIPDINGNSGESVALSADGNTALIGGNGGAAVFVRSGGVWSQQSNTWSVSLATSAALSDDGNTAAFGDPFSGGVFVLNRSGDVWPADSFEFFIQPNDATGGFPQVGQSVSLSADGNTLVFGAPYDAGGIGAFWVFTRSGTNWTQLGSKIVAPPDAEDFADNGFIGFGYSAGISADGNRIIAGGHGNYDEANDVSGAAWMFVQTPGIASVSADKGPLAGGNTVTITGSGFTGVDPATGVTFDGVAATNVVVVDPSHITATVPAHAAGAVEVSVTNPISITSSIGAYTYFDAPAVTSISPTSGPGAGGTQVIITGTGFSGATAVAFGASAATAFTVDSATQITATSPTGTGTVDVRITTPGGTSATSSADQFTYVAPTVTGVSPSMGPTAGGTSVTITGTGFTGTTAVTFGATAATGFTVNSATQITATSPAGTGTVDVTVTTGASSSATSSADRFTYVPAPVVTSVSPTSGPTDGGTTVIITGTNLGTVNDVEFGAANAASFTSLSNTRISAVTPAGTGSVTIRVSTAGGTQNSGVTFTYVARPTITAINPNQGPAKGGTQVSIVGTNLTGATAVRFGPTAATSFSVLSSTSATAIAPPRAAGQAFVTITTPGGTSGASAGARFTYTADPVMKVIAKFVGGANDGGKPFGVLVADKAGALYGTTSVGGNDNKGIIFKLVPAANPDAYWTKTILHEFDGATGATPYAGLVIDNAGNLYGTTTAGGASNKGVVFKYTASTKKLAVLYSFKGNAVDGGVPYAGLARDAEGVLYGFTSEGGRSGFGTAFKIAPNNPFTVTHHFNGTTGDNPRGAPVLDKQGHVYGATVDGGGPNNGLVFRIAPNNARTTLYAFKAAASDGHHPYGPLFTPGGTGAVFFGTTNEGGAQNKGAIFDVMRTTSPPTGAMLYAFTGASGANPFGGVVADPKTILYGTTFNGGARDRGVVFRLIPPANGQPNWTQQRMYSFRGGNVDGANPYAGVLLGKNSTLYGTTSAGGGGACPGGCGNVFQVTY